MIFLKDCLKDRREESGQIEILETTRDNRSFILRTRRRPTSHTPRDPKLKDAYTVVATTNRRNALKLLTLTREKGTWPHWINHRGVSQPSGSQATIQLFRKKSTESNVGLYLIVGQVATIS